MSNYFLTDADLARIIAMIESKAPKKDLTTNDIKSGVFPIELGGTGAMNAKAARENLGVVPQPVTGTYAGTGTVGPANPCTLTFDDVPVFIIISSDKPGSTRPYIALLPAPFVSGTVVCNNDFFKALEVTQDGPTVSWYYNDDHNESYQMNYSGTTYTYTAFFAKNKEG